MAASYSESLPDDILLRIFQKAVIQPAALYFAGEGMHTMGRLPLVCSRFRKLIAASDFFAWGFFDTPVVRSSLRPAGELAFCLSGRNELRWKILAIDLDTVGRSSFVLHADGLSGLLSTSRVSLTQLDLTGVRLLSATEHDAQVACSRLNMLLQLLQKCSNLSRLNIEVTDARMGLLSSCSFVGAFQKLKQLRVGGVSFMEMAEGFDESFPALEVLEVHGMIKGNIVRAAKLVELSCYGFTEPGSVSIHAPALQQLSVELMDEAGGSSYTLCCPGLKRLEFTRSESNECRVLVKLGGPAKEQTIRRLNVSGLDLDVALALTIAFKNVGLLVVRVRGSEMGCIKEKDWRDMFDVGHVARIVNSRDL